jgi:phosphoglycerate dehydrogenase-like enzyme
MFALSIHTWRCVETKLQRKSAFAEVDKKKTELAGSTLLQIGLGDCGGRIAAKAAALGMYVIGCRRRPLPPPPGVMELVHRPQLRDAIARADFVCVQLPLTLETAGFLGEPELKSMKKTAFLINGGRGKTIAKEPMFRALHEGWFAGAALDVTDPEPLPPDDPHWDLPNTILSYHLAGSSTQIERRFIELYSENVRRFVGGETLLNVVDLAARY